MVDCAPAPPCLLSNSPTRKRLYSTFRPAFVLDTFAVNIRDKTIQQSSRIPFQPCVGSCGAVLPLVVWIDA
jgi:hypothetical protein